MSPTAAMRLLMNQHVARHAAQEMDGTAAALSDGAANGVAAAPGNALAISAQTVVIENSGRRSQAPRIAGWWNLYLPPTCFRIGGDAERGRQQADGQCHFPHEMRLSRSHGGSAQSLDRLAASPQPRAAMVDSIGQLRPPRPPSPGSKPRRQRPLDLAFGASSISAVARPLPVPVPPGATDHRDGLLQRPVA